LFVASKLLTIKKQLKFQLLRMLTECQH